MSNILRVLGIAAVVSVAVSGQGQFVPDEFNGATLGSQWTFLDNETLGSTFTLTNGHFNLTAPRDTDFFWGPNNYASLEQDAPAGDNWEVVTKVDNWDPTVPANRRRFSRFGIAVWQDIDHYVTIGLLSDFEGDEIGTQAFWNTYPNGSSQGDSNYIGVLDEFETGPQPSYWLKIQKTPKGYLGFTSTDGLTWRNQMSILRNPETPDGYFTNEKIRIFNAAGFTPSPAPDGDLIPAQFDFVRMNVLTPPIAGYQDDEFNGATLAPQWGYHPGILPGYKDLAGDGNLTIGAGGFSDLWVNKEQPTFIYQDAPTANSYNLTMKGSPTELTAVPFELYNSYGIWLWHDQSNWAFISNQRGVFGDPPTPNNRIEYAFKQDGFFTPGTINFSTPENPQSPCPEYLRVEKNGGECNLQYSFDNFNWVTVVVPGSDGPPVIPPRSNFSVGSDNLQVRLFSKRASGDGSPLDAKFDWLRAIELPPSNVQDWQLF